MEQPPPAGRPATPEQAAAAHPEAPQQVAPPVPRRSRKSCIIASSATILGLLLLCCLAVAGYLGYRFYSESSARNDIRLALEQVAVAEAALKPVDELLSSDFKELQNADLETMRAAIEKATPVITEAQASVKSAQADLSGDAEAVASETLGLLEVEMEALAVTPAILEAAAQGKPAIPPSKTGWKSISEERDLVSQANKEYNKHTEAAVRQSTVLVEKAMTKVRSAQSDYDKASKTYADGKFDGYQEYCRKRILNLQQSLNINSKYVAGDKEGANQLSGAYNSDANELTKLLNSFPAPRETRPVSDGVKAKAAAQIETYDRARRNAAAKAVEVKSAIDALE